MYIFYIKFLFLIQIYSYFRIINPIKCQLNNIYLQHMHHYFTYFNISVRGGQSVLGSFIFLPHPADRGYCKHDLLALYFDSLEQFPMIRFDRNYMGLE